MTLLIRFQRFEHIISEVTAVFLTTIHVISSCESLSEQTTVSLTLALLTLFYVLVIFFPMKRIADWEMQHGPGRAKRPLADRNFPWKRSL